jgi:hypothetical protein
VIITAVVAALGALAALLFVGPWAPLRPAPTSGTTSAAPVPQAPAVPTAAAPPVQAPPSPAPVAADPGERLRTQADADRPLLASVPEGEWVPQLSSKKVGLVADGITYTEQDIWNDHEKLRAGTPGAALLWSGDYTTFKYSDFWVTVVPSAHSRTADAANRWCASKGLDGDHCYAKRIGRTGTYKETTKPR